jgi:hypothetical protein
MPLSHTYTLARVPVSESAFEEIQRILEKAGYQDQITYKPTNELTGTGLREAVSIDMTGLCLENDQVSR